MTGFHFSLVKNVMLAPILEFFENFESLNKNLKKSKVPLNTDDKTGGSCHSLKDHIFWS